ncbi:helix-turn-helix domain-containing protein [Paraburkholderia sacchari]|uniref:helix-turn-helix domain-containing protein n=1 Tax=Paraburkholderia sacchari TaxID=159450 RepID=UPI001BCF4EA9|nr:helix-turn-helix transcriptional regulator [Paraburkholderia sacchari]
MARVLPKPIELTPGAPDLAALGRLVRNRRAQNALRIDDAADQIGVSKDVLSRLENGRPIGLDKLFLILDGLGLSLLVLPRVEASEMLHMLDPSGVERR